MASRRSKFDIATLRKLHKAGIIGPIERFRKFASVLPYKLPKGVVSETELDDYTLRQLARKRITPSAEETRNLFVMRRIGRQQISKVSKYARLDTPLQRFLARLQSKKSAVKAVIELSEKATIKNREEVIAGMLLALNHEDSSVRLAAVRHFPIFSGENSAALSAIHHALKSDKNERVRAGAAWHLDIICQRESVPNLIDALNDPSESVRWYAAEALGAIKDRKAIKPLEELVAREGEHSSVGYIAQKAIEKIKKVLLF